MILTPIYRWIALRCGFVDRPDHTRKLHRSEVAIAGGISVFVALVGAVVLSMSIYPETFKSAKTNSLSLWGLLISASGIVLLGFIDDRFSIRGRQKLAGQIVATSFLVLCGYRMESFQIFGMHIDLGLMSIAVSIGWILFTINALNLIDGADGLCSTIGWVASAGIAAMAAITGHPVESMLAASLSGALLGFLVFNFPPAKIFLGDTGSMLVGLLLGALALRTSLKEATATSLMVPITILALPIFDSAMAIVRRKLTGRSIFSVDRGHLHHNLLRRGFSNFSLVLVVTLLSCTVALGAFLGVLLQNDWIAFGSMLIALGGLVVGKYFGHSEFKLIGARAFHFGGSLLDFRSAHKGVGQHQMIRLQGSLAWDRIWEAFIEFAEKHDLSKICMDLNVPWLHEGFHASWQRSKIPEISERWITKIPIYSDGKMYGRLEVIGKSSQSVFSTLSALAELMEAIQPEVARLSAEVPFQPANSESFPYSSPFAAPTAATRA